MDAHYKESQAQTVGLTFDNWAADEPIEFFRQRTPITADYRPGEFYKRELPGLISLIQQIDVGNVKTIIIDGFVVLDDLGKAGLGLHLFEHLGGNFPVIGLAKTDFRSLKTSKAVVLRGQSKTPLFVTAAGIELNQAAQYIRQMHGPYRIPSLLKLLDQETKKWFD